MKKIKFLLIPVLSILIAGLITGFSISEKSKSAAVAKFGEMYGPIWQMAMDHTLEVAEAMPEEKYDFKPTAVSKTFGEQMVHIAHSSVGISKFMLLGEQGRSPEPKASEMSKAEIINLLKENMGMVKDIIKSMSEEDMMAMTKTFGGNEIPKSQAIIFIHDHLTNHRAKANLYIRMNDMDPPSYKYY
ncbi:MAG: DinB family protein [Candidatus Cyclobacteriaceae bacterium M3_2C_046]